MIIDAIVPNMNWALHRNNGDNLVRDFSYTEIIEQNQLRFGAAHEKLEKAASSWNKKMHGFWFEQSDLIKVYSVW